MEYNVTQTFIIFLGGGGGVVDSFVDFVKKHQSDKPVFIQNIRGEKNNVTQKSFLSMEYSLICVSS